MNIFISSLAPAALALTFALALPGGAAAQSVSTEIAQEAMARLRLANQAILQNRPEDAIKESGLAAHPMFAQVFARMDMPRLNQQAAQLMAEQFTSDELRALVAFQDSEMGKRVQQKMPGFQKLLGSMIQNEMTAAFQGYMASQGGAGGASGLPIQAVPGSAMPAATPAVVPAVPATGLTGSGGTPIKH